GDQPALVELLVELRELQARQRAALAVDGGLVHVGLDLDLLRRDGGGPVGRRRKRGGRGGGRCAGGGGAAAGGSVGRRGLRRLVRRGQEGRLAAVVDLPLVPQHHQREPEDHPEDGAANVVHQDFLSEVSEE